MSTISITRSHNLSAAKAKQAAEQLAKDLDEEYGLEHEWADKHHLTFERSGLSGELLLDKKHVTVNVKLGMLFWAFKPRLEQEIHAYFDREFGTS